MVDRRSDGTFDVLYTLAVFSLRRSEDPSGFEDEVRASGNGERINALLDRLDTLPSRARATLRAWVEAYQAHLRQRQVLQGLEQIVLGEESLVGLADASGLTAAGRAS